MEFITTGNRIAVENFKIGYFYTITMLSGNSFQACCTGIGSDFVMFSRDEPDLLYSLTMKSAADVSSIELYGGGSGTNDYNDLINKPQINSITLIGNKSISDLGIQETISDLNTIRSGAAAGATAVQPADLATALATKQDTLSSAQLAAVNSGIDSNKVAQIETNKNNISFLTANGGGKNKYSVDATVTGSYQVDATKTSTGYQLSANGAWAHMVQEVILPSAGRYVISMTISNYNSNVSTYAPSIIICPTSSISAPYLGSKIIEGNGEIVLTVETTNPILYISFYVNRSSASSPTSSFEASNVMVCSESEWATSHQYQPYAMSNAELTAAIQALQAQLANQ